MTSHSTAVDATAPVANPHRVSIWRVIPWSTPGFSMNALIVMTGYFSIYATDTLALNPAVVGGLLVAAKIVDAIGALLAGYIVDRAPQTRLGKARPFELSIVACWALTAFMFSTPGSLGDVAKYAWIFLSYLLLTALFMPLYNACNPLYTARVFPHRDQYSDVAAKSGIVTVFAGILITIGMPIAISTAGKDPGAWGFIAVCIAIPATLVGLVRFWVFREPREAGVEADRVRVKDIVLVLRSNPYIWVLSLMGMLVGVYGTFTAGAYYYRYIVGDIALMGIASIGFVATIPFILLFPILVRKVSVSRLVAITSFIGAVGYLVMMFAGANIGLILVSAALTALAALPINFLSPILIIDNATVNEWKGHRRLESVGGAVYAFAGTVGAAIAAGISGVVLAVTGYSGTADQQTGFALAGIVALNSWIPALLAVVTGLVALFYHRLEGRIKQISAEVVERRERAAGADTATVTNVGGTEAVRQIREEHDGRP